VPRLVRTAVAGLLVVVAVLLAGPAVAAQQGSYFQVAIVADGGYPMAGQSWSFYATLHSEDDQPIAGQQVDLLTRVEGSGDPFRVAATVLTDDSGFALARVTVVRNTAYRWHFAGDQSFTASSTNTLVQSVGSKVVPHVSDSTPAVYQPFAVTGRVYPDKAGQRIHLLAGKYFLGFGPPAYSRQLAVARVRADGTFRLVGQLTRTGPQTLFVRVDGDAENADGYSKYLRVTVH